MIHSFKVATTLAAYRCVAAAAAAHTVQYPAAANVLPLGITKDTVKDTTQAIPVAGPGEKALLYFNETMAAGGLVGSDTSGRGTPFIIGANTVTAMTVAAMSLAGYVGVLVGPTIGLTGTLAEVYICPGIANGNR